MPESSLPQPCRANVREQLLASFDDERGGWHSRLSSSALATAVGTFTLHSIVPEKAADAIADGTAWLVNTQNRDGGWGDTPDSPSNISTSILAWATVKLFPDHGTVAANAAAAWLERHLGSLDANNLAEAVISSYGKDRTFAAPILTMCALAGVLGPESQAWALVPQLPFQYALMPQSLLRRLHLQVVSYALPALIAVGLVRHRRGPWTLGRRLRNMSVNAVLRKLQEIQPAHGGYLDATPLTGFVAMSIAAAGFPKHAVVDQAVQFLQESQDPDGSWAIDSNLDTWVTTLSVAATLPHDPDALSRKQKEVACDWLLNQQHLTPHQYTGAAPGGWAWTDCAGGVPDADDTAGALIALRLLVPDDPQVLTAAQRGVEWLLDLQNSDGGIPTFCRGWGRLPFDRSCPDISAHALTAWERWHRHLPSTTQSRIDNGINNLLAYLAAAQNADGAWVPLWFGNQGTPSRQNPVYGTARVLIALQDSESQSRATVEGMIKRGRQWLIKSQNPDGGWGGDSGISSTIEETALATRALCHGSNQSPQQEAGVEWLLQNTLGADELPAAPIGLYFASLWYSEQLYPVIFTADALGAAGVLPKSLPGWDLDHGEDTEASVFACGGSCDAGCIAERTARLLTAKGLAKMFGLPRIETNIHQVVKPSRNTGTILAIDGCTARCCSERLKAAGISPDAQLQLSDVGIDRKQEIPLDESETRVIAAARKILQQLRHEASPPNSDNSAS